MSIDWSRPTGTADNRTLPLISYSRVPTGVSIWKRPKSMVVVVLESVDDGSRSVLRADRDPSTDDWSLNDNLAAIPTASFTDSR